jgi:hypothetical protein
MDSDTLNSQGTAELIPPEAIVLRRVSRIFMHGGKPDPGAFQNATPQTLNERPGMSVLWRKYCQNQDCLALDGGVPATDSVAELDVSSILAIEGQTVVHEPNMERRLGGRAHSEVYGDKPTGVRRRLRKAARVVHFGGDDPDP